MALIDIDDFKEALGVGNIYADALLQSVIDAAEAVVSPLLTYNRAGIQSVVLQNNIATYWTIERNEFVAGQSIVISGIGSPFDGTKTILEGGVRYFTVAITNANIIERRIYPMGYAVLASQVNLYDTDERVRQAALMIAIDIWHARISASGAAEGVDFSPAPWKMGRSLYSRVAGLLQSVRDPRGMVG